jgi:hypothetical protein
MNNKSNTSYGVQWIHMQNRDFMLNYVWTLMHMHKLYMWKFKDFLRHTMSFVNFIGLLCTCINYTCGNSRAFQGTQWVLWIHWTFVHMDKMYLWKFKDSLSTLWVLWTSLDSCAHMLNILLNLMNSCTHIN